MSKKILPFAIITYFIFLLFQSCSGNYKFRSVYKDTNSLLHTTSNLLVKPYLKAHLKNGNVCIFNDIWKIDSSTNSVIGFGTLYDFNRNVLKYDKHTILIDSVAIFETNKKLTQTENERVMVLSILTGIDIIAGIICLTNPKACFGSCPTFYVKDTDDFHYADAEGFSSAISPSMEYGDIDALNNKEISSDSYTITMKNEALETHCVKDMKLYAFPRNKGEKILQTPDNKFYRCKTEITPVKAVADEGDIVSLLSEEDKIERFSLSDETNLKSREELYLDFDIPSKNENLGLILDFRQTLMTTYFIYSAIGYMGDQVGDFFAKIENSGNTGLNLKNGIKKELGEIEIFSWNDQNKKWDFQGSFYETGPIAINKQLIPIKRNHSSSKVKLKVVLNKGLWRLDYAALTYVKEERDPIIIAPESITKKGKPDSRSLSNLNTKEKYLISMPGDEYKFNFKLPSKDHDYELFIYTKGYYIEWMREHWIKDKNLLKLNQMVNRPRTFLLEEAKNYKTYESTMEENFWNSRINSKNFTYDEK